MKYILVVLLILALIGVLASLFSGIFGLTRKNRDMERSNRLMRYRIMFQGAAVVIFVLLMALYGGR